jgi:chromosome segregation ATPase
MEHGHPNPMKKLSEMRVEASKKKVKASKHYLRCRTLEEKCVNAQIDLTELEVDRKKLMKRKHYFESKIDELQTRFEGQPTTEVTKKEIQQRRRKASEIQTQIDAFTEKIEEERKDIEKMRKKADEQLRKSEEATKECKDIEMEIVKLEIKLGIKK